MGLRYMEFIKDIGLQIKEVTVPEYIVMQGEDFAPVVYTSEMIDTRRFHIGYKGEKERMLEKIRILTEEIV